jgi:hypothetical protein
MGARGPRSGADLARVVVPMTEHRPAPPAELTKGQAEEWRRIVDRMPHDWFPQETHSILVALCRHICHAREIAGMINEFQPAWCAEEGGLERLDRLGKMLDREHRGVATMATKLRLTNQSRYTDRRAATQSRQVFGGPIQEGPWTPPWERFVP